MQPRKELAGTDEGERAAKVIVAEAAECRDALAGRRRLPYTLSPLGPGPQFGKQFGRALGEDLCQSCLVGIARHYRLISLHSVEPAKN
jgi:hypothetical protein